MEQKKLPFKKALLWILLSTLLVSGSTSAGIYLYHTLRESRISDDKYHIVAIVQTGSDKEALKTVYLAELLDLSIDQPVNLYRFNTEDAQSKLLASPLIKSAEVKKINPGTIYVDYTIRKPVAYLGDYSNTAIDTEGVVFPFKPFFTPKKLPEIYLGLTDEDTIQWGAKQQGHRAELALTLFSIISSNYCTENHHLRQIDVSKADAESYGQREIVVIMEEQIKKGDTICHCPRILRLDTKNITQALANYMVLNDYLREQEDVYPVVIDLRIPQLAFITKGDHNVRVY